MQLKTKKVIAKELLIFLSTVFIGVLILATLELSYDNRHEKTYKAATSNAKVSPHKFSDLLGKDLLEGFMPDPETYNIYYYGKIITVDYYGINFDSSKYSIIEKAKDFPEHTKWGHRDSKNKWEIDFKITNVQKNISYLIWWFSSALGIILICMYPLQYFIRLILWAVRTLKQKEA